MKTNIIKQGSILTPYREDDEEKLNKLSNGVYSVDLKDMDTRTLQQNRAYWKWCKSISETLNDSGLYVNDILKLETKWSKDKIHSNIMLPVIKSLYNKESTTKLNKKEYDEIIDTVINAFSQKGIQIPNFPYLEQ